MLCTHVAVCSCMHPFHSYSTVNNDVCIEHHLLFVPADVCERRVVRHSTGPCMQYSSDSTAPSLLWQPRIAPKPTTKHYGRQLRVLSRGEGSVRLVKDRCEVPQQPKHGSCVSILLLAKELHQRRKLSLPTTGTFTARHLPRSCSHHQRREARSRAQLLFSPGRPGP